ncbi:MAG: putative phenazine biosynthesis protein PhzF [Modestobacter sp.]|jgi:predicted PhzF superfamily epimerase YddE/YHI9|nr:putative phenazine biosynthesis protein PhzF [Modestobacter sp.]MCW2617969.1 putative phenazine biosynthesis protein PhzF [Modestobacter sp.]
MRDLASSVTGSKATVAGVAPRRPDRPTYEVVDVFAPRPYGGNPLAVVFGAADPTTEQCQAPAFAGRVRRECGAGEGVPVLSWDAATSTAYAVVFADDLHRGEDPATGSAARGAGVWPAATVSGAVRPVAARTIAVPA